MAHMMHRRSQGGVFLATPSFGGVEPGFAFALYESAKELERLGIKTELAINAGDCHVDDSRNRLVKQFLESDCTHLLFLDSDLRWEAKDLVRLINVDKDVVGATYPLKQETEGYPVIMGEYKREGELIEVEALPTGFLKIKRGVLQALADQSDKYYGKKDSTPTPLIFERSLVGTQRWGGDTTFCRKWREMGGRVYLLPDPIMEHSGNRIWSGAFSDYLNAQEQGAIPAAINAIREGRANFNTFIKAYKDMGNPFAASPMFYMTLLNMKGRVLECGSGLSSIYMAANGCDVHCLEHDPRWANELAERANEMLTDEESSRIHIYTAPLSGGWYSFVPDGEFDGLVVDGPPRELGDRGMVSRVLQQINGLVVTDDGFKDLPLHLERIDERVSIGNTARSH